MIREVEKESISKLMCPLGDELAVSREVVEFLEKHYHIDVIKDGKYLFTLKRLEKFKKEMKEVVE